MVFQSTIPSAALFIAFVKRVFHELNPGLDEGTEVERKLLSAADVFFSQDFNKTSKPWKQNFKNAVRDLSTPKGILAAAHMQNLIEYHVSIVPGRFAYPFKQLRVILHLMENPAMAELQMDRQTPGSAVPTATQAANPSINASMTSTMASHAPAMSVLPVEHLPQLATMLPGQGIPTMVNTPINNTMEDGPLIEARTTYLPTEMMAFGGIVEDYKDIATGSYQVVEVLSIPVNTQQGTVIFRKVYGLDMLGGFAKGWVQMHKRYAGPIQFKISVIASTITQGLLRIGYNQGENVKINVANSSKFGAVDFDLSKDNNDIFFTIRPTSEGKFFFRTDDETTPDQGFIFGLLLTNLTNNFSELGSIQVIISSRLHPEFCVADPRETIGTGPVTTTATLQDYINASLVNTAESTLYVESRMYPKYPDVNAEERSFPLMLEPTKETSTRLVAVVTGTPTTGKIHTYDNNYGYTRTQVVADGGVTQMRMSSLDITNGAAVRTVKVAYPTVTMNWSYKDIAPVANTYPAVVETSCYNKLNALTTLENLVIQADNDVSSLGAEEGVLLPLVGNPKLASAGQITGVNVATEYDNKTLPSGYYTVEFAPTATPAATAAAIASNLNLTARSDLGWVIHNWCRANCPAEGQVKITISDPTFSQIIMEMLYRPSIGFMTTAGTSHAYTFLNSNLSGYEFSSTIYNDQVPITLNNDFGGFTSMVAAGRSAQRQMFNIFGGLMGGIGQGLSNEANYRNNMNMQNLIGSQQLNNINAQGNWGLMNTKQQGRNQLRNTKLTGENTFYNTRLQAEEQRKTSLFNMGMSNLGNNMMSSPQNNAASRQSGTQSSPMGITQHSSPFAIESPGAYRMVNSSESTC